MTGDKTKGIVRNPKITVI